MSASKTSPSPTHKRRPYHRPTLTRLTPEEAKAMLEAQSIPRDERARKNSGRKQVRLEEKNDKRAQ